MDDRRRRRPWQLAWTLCALTACGGRLIVDEDNPGAPGGAAGADAGRGAANAGGASGSAASGAGRSGQGDAAVRHDAGGAGGVADARADARAEDSAGASGGAAGAGGADAGTRDAGRAAGGAPSVEGGVPCAIDADCPPPDRNCAVSRCRAGECETANAPSGATVRNVPADCHASVCDGEGNATSVVVDQTNRPTPDHPCLAGTCNAAGKTGTAPVAADTACSVPPGAVMCDGAGNCVECNHTADCESGKFCNAEHTCGTAPCTDTDCGGACVPCDLGRRCLVDADCVSYACDAQNGTCIENPCLDHRRDGNETDLDCGGGICGGCALGEHCVLDGDCNSVACDASTFTCISNQCADHHIDGDETDVDCGGGTCSGCLVGHKCKTNFDCVPGRFCSATVPHVCQ